MYSLPRRVRVSRRTSTATKPEERTTWPTRYWSRTRISAKKAGNYRKETLGCITDNFVTAATPETKPLCYAHRKQGAKLAADSWRRPRKLARQLLQLLGFDFETVHQADIKPKAPEAV